MNLASLGAIAGGINQGLEYSQRDKERKDNQEFLKNQRQFLQDQQAQQKDQWKRDDEFAAAWNEASSPTKTVTQSVPDLASETVDENGDLPMTQVAVTVPRTNVEIAGAQHAAALKARRYDLAEKALESKNRYIREGDLNLYRDFDTSLGGELNDDVASRVQKMVTSDGTPIGIDGYKANGDGSYTFNVRNKFNDFAVPVTVRSPDELRSVIRQHLDYNGYAAEQAERRKLAQSIAAKRAEGVRLRPGETFSQYDKDGRLIPVAENNNITPAESSLLRGGAAGVGGASGSKSGGKAAEDPGMKVLKDIFGMKGPGGVDHTGDQAAAAYNYYNNIPDALPGGAKLAPEMKARIAYDAAINPNTVQTDIDPSTFEITRFYKSAPIKGANGSYVSPAPIPLSKWNIGQAFAAASQDDESGKQARAVLGASTRKLIDSLPESERIGVIDSAHSDQARANFTGQYWSSLRRQVADRTDIPEAAKERWIDQNMAILNRKIDLAKNFYDAPEWTKERGSSPSSKFSPEQVNAAKKYGYGSETSIGDVISRAGRGLSSAWSKLMTPSQEAIDNALRTMRSTGRLDSGNANFLAGAFKRNPDLMKSFTSEQLDAIRVISGQNF